MSNQTERVDHLAAALRYASQGVPVFPLAPRSKFPLISAANGGHGLHDATTDAAQIQAWWMAHPTANIGLRTGLSFDVVDLDSEDAVDALEQARAGREQLRGPVVTTGHGFHWYVLATGLGNRASVFHGVDYRGQGGYVVGPPSVHPQGHRYRWINPLLEELAPAPGWLIHLLVPERGSVRPRTVPEGPEPMDLERCAESFNGSPRQGKALATTNSTPLRSIWAGW